MSDNMQEKLYKVQKMLDIVLCDMSPSLGAIQGAAEILEDYLAQLAEQRQVTAVTINPDMEITPKEALELVRDLLKSVNNLATLRLKTHDDIRSLYSEE